MPVRWVAGVLAWLCAGAAFAAALDATQDYPAAIGLATQVLAEADGPLTVAEARAALRAGQFKRGTRPVLNFGIGAEPVWIHFAVDNPGQVPVRKRLSIETSWLDRVDVFVGQDDRVAAIYRVGDTLPFARRPIPDRFFVLDHAFQPGASEVLLRIETPDPMAVPIFLSSADASAHSRSREELSYGIVYGFLLALIAYNAVLAFSLRSWRYLLYGIYLAAFVVVNIAYTGHGFQWLWPDSPAWQQWSNPVLMVLYGVSGLLFAARFLELQATLPRLYGAVRGFGAAAGVLLLASVLADAQQAALLVAFCFVFLFTLVMPILGVVAVRAGQKPARYFLLAATAAMLGALTTTLSVWGFIPFNAWTFRAVEIGMLVDATLLALALAYQLRLQNENMLRAERLAQIDPLTGLDNRRAFYDKTRPLWANAIRSDHPTSLILLDVDHFKRVNDEHGHNHGDEVLKSLADVLRLAIRQGDVLARWGGEEFIVFLPETSVQEAATLAEQLREAVCAIPVSSDTGTASVTASFGVAQKTGERDNLDALIASADVCLRQSKQRGRNRVTAAEAGWRSSEACLNEKLASPLV